MDAKAKLYLLLIYAVMVLLMSTGGCNKDTSNHAIVSYKSLAAYQKELLAIAFDTASSIPVKPFIKDRSRTQVSVINTCLKLNQPDLAFAYTEKVENWQRGLCYANLAYYYAGLGRTKNAQQCLELAEPLANKDYGQEWRNNRIKAVIAKTSKKLGQTEKAVLINNDLADSNTDSLAVAEAQVNTDSSFDEQVKVLDGLIDSGDFSIVNYSLQTYAGFFDQFYDDKDRRQLAEEKIKTFWGKIPVSIKVDLMMELAGFALDHNDNQNDNQNAMELINEVQIFIGQYHWPLKKHIPITAKLVGLRFRAGDGPKALSDANAALTLFNEQKNEIIDIYRAKTILPLAQAYQLMGQEKKSIAIYKQAVEESIVNPNSRPRAEDLSAICCSMSVNAVVPDAELWSRIRQISEELAKSW